jgi:integrase
MAIDDKPDAPGLKIKKNKDGSLRYYWEARTDAVKRGYKPSNVRLHYDDEMQRAARCRVLQAEMLSWLANGDQFPKRTYDGTMASLARLFASDEDSPYQACKWNTQRLYDGGIRVINATVGTRVVRELLGPDFTRWHRNWGKPAAEGKPPRLHRAKHTIDLVRRIIAYGVTCGHADCIRADHILAKMRFDSPPARKEAMTAEQVVQLRAKAHEMDLPSIAIATAFQFDLALRQKDVIGEWLPASEGEMGGIVYKKTRWANGLVWPDIGSDLILRKLHTKTEVVVEYDLQFAPNVLAEIELCGRRLGPIIISEKTGDPYRNTKFSETFRKVAKAAGIPPQVWSMDARAGAISEAYDAGASGTDVQKHAGHTNPQTSARYNRTSVEQTRRAMRTRVEKRIKNKE